MADSPVVRSLKVGLLLPLSLVLAVIVVGTLGYRWLWHDMGGTWMDALFMTVTTITTIGYGEVKPLTTAGRLFTIGLAFTGIGSLFYTLGVIMEYLVSVRLADPTGRRRMERRIGELTGHVVVAGLGRVGLTIWPPMVIVPAPSITYIISFSVSCSAAGPAIGRYSRLA